MVLYFFMLLHEAHTHSSTQSAVSTCHIDLHCDFGNSDCDDGNEGRWQQRGWRLEIHVDDGYDDSVYVMDTTFADTTQAMVHMLVNNTCLQYT